MKFWSQYLVFWLLLVKIFIIIKVMLINYLEIIQTRDKKLLYNVPNKRNYFLKYWKLLCNT